MRSCPSTTSGSHRALRLEAEFQYTRIFNEPPTVSRSPVSAVFSSPRCSSASTSFSSLSPPASAAYSPDAFSSFALACFFFPRVSSDSSDTERERERERERKNSFADRGIAFLYFPARRETREDHVVAVRLESGIYCQLNGPVPRPPYPERSF